MRVFLFLSAMLWLTSACEKLSTPTAESACKHQLAICGEDVSKLPECLTSLDASINVYRELLKKEENKGVATLAPDTEIYRCLQSIPDCDYLTQLEVREYCYFPTVERRKVLRRNTGIRDWPPAPQQETLFSIYWKRFQALIHKQ